MIESCIEPVGGVRGLGARGEGRRRGKEGEGGGDPVSRGEGELLNRAVGLLIIGNRIRTKLGQGCRKIGAGEASHKKDEDVGRGWGSERRKARNRTGV